LKVGLSDWSIGEELGSLEGTSEWRTTGAIVGAGLSACEGVNEGASA